MGGKSLFMNDPDDSSRAIDSGQDLETILTSGSDARVLWYSKICTSSGLGLSLICIGGRDLKATLDVVVDWFSFWGCTSKFCCFRDKVEWLIILPLGHSGASPRISFTELHDAIRWGKERNQNSSVNTHDSETVKIEVKKKVRKSTNMITKIGIQNK